MGLGSMRGWGWGCMGRGHEGVHGEGVGPVGGGAGGVWGLGVGLGGMGGGAGEHEGVGPGVHGEGSMRGWGMWEVGLGAVGKLSRHLCRYSTVR